MEALGPVLVLISIPLMLRWVPPNRLYGFRIAATLRNRSVWYDVNARCAWHFFLLGLLMVVFEFALPRAIHSPALWVIGMAGFAIIVVVNWRMAYRLERERTTTHPARMARVP